MVVFEAAGAVGGRTITDDVEGFRIDPATQLFGSMYSGVRRLVEELALGNSWHRSPGRDALWRGGRAHEVVYGSVMSMLTSGGLPLRTKLRLGTHYLPYLSEKAALLDLHHLYRAAAGGLDRESIAEWGEREIGRDFVDYLVYPLLTAYYGSEPDETVSAVYHLLARQGLEVSVYALSGGAGQLCEAVAARIRSGGGEVMTGATAAAVEESDTGVGVRFSGSQGDRFESFDGVVVATPAPVAKRLLGQADTELGRWLDGVRYRPAVSTALLLDQPLHARYFGLSFPRGEAGVISSLCVEENKVSGLVPANQGLLVAFASPTNAAQLWEASSREVVDVVLPEVVRTFERIESRIRRAKVYRWEHGNAIFYPGYLQHLTRFHEGGVEGGGPIVLAGDYLRFPNTEGAVTSGEAAAMRLQRRLERSGPAQR